MNNLTKRFIRFIFNLLSLDVSRKVKHGFYEPYFDNSIDIILDIGANIGQFVHEIRAIGYARNIVSFEPLSEAHAILLNNSQRDQRWEAYRRCAIGDKPGFTQIQESKNSVSSSLRQMNSRHIEAAPNSRYIASESVEIIALNDIFQSLTSDYKRVAIKIDTQGFEMEVLLGLGKYLKEVAIFQLELSIQELYEGQSLFIDFFNFFETHKFQLRTIKPGFTNPKTGRMLQFDAIFENSEFQEGNRAKG